MSKKPVYSSKSSVKSLWQQYHIFDDHLEFETLFGKLNVPFNQIERVEIEESDLKGLLKGDLQLKNFRPALKLDWANFLEHVVVDKKGELVKRILFTPDNVQEFKRILDEQVNQYLKKEKQNNKK
jgi:hypothetical protein